MSQNQYLAIANGSNANALTYAQWAALGTLLAQGFQSGVVPSVQFNTFLRQLSVPTSALAQLIADNQSADVLDDGVVANFEAKLRAAIQNISAYVTQAGQSVFFAAGGSSTVYTGTLAPAPTSLTPDMEVLGAFGTANSSTSPTLNLNGLGAKPILKQGGGAPAAGDISGFVPLILNSAGSAWIINGPSLSDYSSAFLIGTDTGTAGGIVVASPTPTVTALKTGLTLVTVPAAVNTAPNQATTINLAGLGQKPVIYPNGSPFLGGEMQPVPQEFIFDGASWRWQAVPSPTLQQPVTLYVNYATGSDTNNGLTTATAYKTVQTALATAAGINGNGKTLTIQLADYTTGSHPSFSVVSAFNGLLKVKGNETTPANVSILGTGTNSAAASATANVTLSGMTLANSGTAAAHGLAVASGAIVTFGPGLVFGSCVNGNHMNIDTGQVSVVFVYSVNGNAQNHINLANGKILMTPSTAGAITITNAALSGYFMAANDLSYARVANVSFSGSFSSGTKYLVAGNSLISTGGAGTGFFPAPTAGTNLGYGAYQ